MMKMQVNEALCLGCGACVDVCPNDAVRIQGRTAKINPELCSGCASCAEVCPVEAINRVEAPAKPQVIVPSSHDIIQPVRSPQPAASKLKPAAQAALSFMGREIVPRLTNAFLAYVDQKTEDRLMSPSPSSPRQSLSQAGSFRPRRRRQRRGRL